MWNCKYWKTRMFIEMKEWTSVCHVERGLTQFCVSIFRICCMTFTPVSLLPTDCALLPLLPWSCYFYSTSPNRSLNLLSQHFFPCLLLLLSSIPSIHLFLCLCCLCLYLCVQMYPAVTISHIEESKRPVTIHSWCKKGWGRCQPHPFIVLPYRCLGKNNTPRCHMLHNNTIRDM